MAPIQRERAGDGVEVLRLDRPEARNAMNSELLAAVEQALAELADDASLRALVFGTTDTKALSAGADVREELDEEGGVRRMELFARLYNELTGFPKPTVAACHGAVVGAGAEIVVACDLRVAGGNLRLKFPGGELGVPVGPARLVTLCGLSAAKYLLLTARNVSADEAFRMGLVHRVAPAARTEEAALELAGEVAAHPPEAVSRLKRMLLSWDGVVERSADEGRGQVEWQRSGPGLPYKRD
jgi:enoyl-CoA hydratase/carnithine racemase